MIYNTHKFEIGQRIEPVPEWSLLADRQPQPYTVAKIEPLVSFRAVHGHDQLIKFLDANGNLSDWCSGAWFQPVKDNAR